MKGLCLAFARIVLALPLAFSASASAGLAEKIQEELGADPAPIHEFLKQEVQARHFVFAAGYFNEFSPGYFGDTRKSLDRDFGAGRGTMHKLSSFLHMNYNADWLARHLREDFLEGKRRPIVIVGHSKGAAEALLAVMRHPDLLEEGIVERLVLIQAAVGGSPAAGLMPVHPGTISLLPPVARHTFAEQMKKLTPEQLQFISSRVTWVRARVKKNFISPLLAPLWLICAASSAPVHSAENDGVVLVEAQKLPTIGRDLDVLDADHADLVISGFSVSNSSGRYKRAFARALMREVFEEELR